MVNAVGTALSVAVGFAVGALLAMVAEGMDWRNKR